MNFAKFRILGWSLTTLVLLLLAGCQSPGPEAGVIRPRSPSQVPPPTSVSLPQVAPRIGSALTRARLPLQDILAQLPRLAYLASLTTQPNASVSAPTTQPTTGPRLDASLIAERAYTAGRLAWRKGENFEAIRQLTTAQSLEPKRPEILHLLGLLYITIGNRERGIVYLQQGLALDPTDPDSLFILSRAAFEEGKWDTTIVLLAYALALPTQPLDAGVPPLMRHFLGTALERQGYDAAAIRQYVAYLEISSSFSRTTRFPREMLLLQRQRGQTWQSVGDAYLRLDEVAAAFDAYQRAADYIQPDERPALVSRLAYIYLLQGRDQEAVQVVLDFFRDSAQSPTALRLVQYLIQQGLPARTFVPALQEAYHDNPQSAALAVALADLLPENQSRTLLLGHLAAQPTDWLVYEHLVKRLLAADSSAEALRVTDRLIAQLPRGGQQYTGILLQAAGDPTVILKAYAALQPTEQARPNLQLIDALALQRTGQTDPAIALLKKTVADQPQLEPARLTLVQLLLERNQTLQAQEYFQPLAERAEPEVIRLRLQLFQASGRIDQALSLLNDLLTQHPDNLEFILDKAGFLLLSNNIQDAQTAERLLWDTLGSRPLAEPVYRMLFTIYDQRRVPDADAQRLRLLRRAAQNIPQARLTRLQLVEEQIRINDLDQAQQMLRGLLAEHPDDPQVLELQLTLYLRTNRQKEAEELLAQRVPPDTTDRGLLTLAQRYYATTNDKERFFQVTERLLLRDPPGVARAQKLATLYLQNGRPQKARDVLTPVLQEATETPAETLALLGRALLRTNQADQIDGYFAAAVQRWPRQAPELNFEWAMLLQRLGQNDRAEKLLLAVLAQDPQHANANNGLGYSWAYQGRNLEPARKLIQTALAAEPKNPAFLDSLGWVYYKLGQYAAAVEYFNQARLQPGGDNPVIFEHLGDTLWRLDRHKEAMRFWKLAQEGITAEMAAEDAEAAAAAENLPRKLAAAAAGRQPPLAEPAGTQPATQP